MSDTGDLNDFNQQIIDEVNDVINTWKATYPDEPIIPIKADYMAERSIEDNIVLETQQNTSIVVISYILMLLYVSVAIGFFPDIVHMKFGLGCVGILVVIFSLMAGIGFTFYANQKLTMICLLYTSPSPRDATLSRMPSSA